ncbi:hypothetical protein [Phaffia rhodozyma]|uniref:PEX14-like helix-turn-helix domain-containing protein n=1 Tax=Phaffia rhodozyma TaxID=264483 RepID=A0A0F7SQR4_PHARH|nr:hypothetical protein [Phaffia rhodozyma]
MSSNTSAETSLDEQNTALFVQFQSYDFDNDIEFSTKVLPLLSKLESNGIGTDVQDLLLKAKARYLSRKQNIIIDIPTYNNWLASPLAVTSDITLTPDKEITANGSDNFSIVTPTVHNFIASPVPSEGQPPIAPLPLQELAKLIAQGRVDEIPVLHVEERFHTAPEKTEVTVPVLKPWERVQKQS